MKLRNGRFNPKRKLQDQLLPEKCACLAQTVKYTGNPEHKRNPGDFGLTPPADAKPYKTHSVWHAHLGRAAAGDYLTSSGIASGDLHTTQYRHFTPRTWPAFTQFLWLNSTSCIIDSSWTGSKSSVSCMAGRSLNCALSNRDFTLGLFVALISLVQERAKTQKCAFSLG